MPDCKNEAKQKSAKQCLVHQAALLLCVWRSTQSHKSLDAINKQNEKHFRDVVRKKTGLCGKNSQVADPLPTPPSLGIFTFLPFFKDIFCHFISP